MPYRYITQNVLVRHSIYSGWDLQFARNFRIGMPSRCSMANPRQPRPASARTGFNANKTPLDSRHGRCYHKRLNSSSSATPDWPRSRRFMALLINKPMIVSGCAPCVEDFVSPRLGVRLRRPRPLRESLQGPARFRRFHNLVAKKTSPGTAPVA
jgi:hypothetical protein